MPGVDRIIVARQAHIVAHRLRLAEAGQAERASRRAWPPSRDSKGAGSSMSTPVASSRPVSKISASSMSRPRLPVKVSRAGADRRPCRASRPALGVHRLALLEALPQAFAQARRHRRRGRRPCWLRCWRRRSGRRARRPAASRDTGRPPITPRRASASIRSAAGRGVRIVNSLKKCSFKHARRPGMRGEPVGELRRRWRG